MPQTQADRTTIQHRVIDTPPQPAHTLDNSPTEHRHQQWTAHNPARLRSIVMSKGEHTPCQHQHHHDALIRTADRWQHTKADARSTDAKHGPTPADGTWSSTPAPGRDWLAPTYLPIQPAQPADPPTTAKSTTSPKSLTAAHHTTKATSKHSATPATSGRQGKRGNCAPN